MYGKHKSITISDVAKRAGVSVATVSRVMNGVESVTPKNLQAVEKAIAEMNYKPNSIGRNLRCAQTNRIVVLQPSIANPFYSRVVRGINAKAREAGYQIMVCDTNSNPELEQSYLDLLEHRVADGAILITSCLEPAEYREIANRYPLIFCCEYYSDPAIPCVTMDNVQAVKDAIHYLISIGHRRIGFFSSYNKYLTVGQRLQGYKLALEEEGIPIEDDLIVNIGPIHDEFIWEVSLKQATRFSEMKHPPTAVFCSSDMVAIAANHAFKAQGVRVPEDISIMGFDDIEIAHLFDPGLTTVHIPQYRIGRKTCKLLLDTIEEQTVFSGSNNRIIEKHSIVIRTSTRPLRV